jgi:Fe-S cluster assembly protein SufD
MEVVLPLQEKPASNILAGSPAQRNAHLPAWFRALQQSAWADFSVQPMPGRKDQPWRFSNVNALDLAPYSFPGKLEENERTEILDCSVCLTDVSARLVFADDQLLERDTISKDLQQRGVIFQPIERALVEHEALFRKHFMSEPTTLGSSKFAALHAAAVVSGVFLYIPKGVQIETPIEIFRWLHAENAAVFPHLLLVAEELSSVTVFEHFRSTDGKRPGFACGVNDLIARAGAKITYVCEQNWSREVVSLQLNATTVERDASALSLNVHLGGAYSRFESQSRLIGEGARSDLLAVTVADGKQEFDARTLQDHASPHTNSDLLYKNALSDASRTIFGGLIRVEPHAHFTDAYQKVRNLLLSDDAEADSMPGLEILADNVKCSHGATSGQVNEDEYFYLLTRGLPPKAAHHLLVSGFLNEVITRLPHRPIAEKVHDLIEEKFAG